MDLDAIAQGLRQTIGQMQQKHDEIEVLRYKERTLQQEADRLEIEMNRLRVEANRLGHEAFCLFCSTEPVAQLIQFVESYQVTPAQLQQWYEEGKFTLSEFYTIVLKWKWAEHMAEIDKFIKEQSHEHLSDKLEHSE